MEPETCTAMRESIVPREIKELERVLGTLEGTIGPLAERLEPVMAKPEPKPEKELTKPPLSGCPLGQQISNIAEGLVTVRKRLEDITSRIEL